MTSRLLLGAIATLLLLPTMASGQAVRDERDFVPGHSYLLFQLDHFIREEDGEPLQRAQVHFARYDLEAEDIRGGGRAADNPVPEGESLRVNAFKNQLEREGKKRLYLLEVQPDTWTIEAAALGMSGTLPDMTTSFSLGSYTFEVGEGQIIDLGVLVPIRPHSDNPDTQISAGRLLRGILSPGGMQVEQVPYTMEFRQRGPDDISLPDWLSELPLTPVELTYGNRFGNYSGGLVNRIDGVSGRNRSAPEQDPAMEEVVSE